MGTFSPPYVTVPSRVAPVSGKRYSYQLQPPQHNTQVKLRQRESRDIFYRRKRKPKESDGCFAPHSRGAESSLAAVTAALQGAIAMLVLMLRTLPSHIKACTEPDPLNE